MDLGIFYLSQIWAEANKNDYFARFHLKRNSQRFAQFVCKIFRTILDFFIEEDGQSTPHPSLNPTWESSPFLYWYSWHFITNFPGEFCIYIRGKICGINQILPCQSLFVVTRRKIKISKIASTKAPATRVSQYAKCLKIFS